MSTDASSIARVNQMPPIMKVKPLAERPLTSIKTDIKKV